MPHLKQLIAAAALSAGLASPAISATFEGAVTQGGTVVTDYASSGLISFDIDFANFMPAVVEYRVDGDDIGTAIDFNAILRNFTGEGITGFTIALSQGSFGILGSVHRQFGGSAIVTGGGQLATISFSTPEFLDIEIGNALGTTPAAMDWTITGLTVGDHISLTVTPVPEPAAYALFTIGLGAVLLRARRSRRR